MRVKVALLVFNFGICLWGKAIAYDSLRFVQIEQRIIAVEKYNNELQRMNIALEEKFSLLDKSINSTLLQKQIVIDSLKKIVAENSEKIQDAEKRIGETAENLGLKIQTTDKAVSQTSDNLKSKTLWGLVAVVFALLISVIVALLLHKKVKKTSEDKIASLKKQADELNEKIVGQLCNEVLEMQKIGDSLKNAGAIVSSESDHSLVKTLADRITFMEMTLYRMDCSVKGHKQLSKSIAQMKDNLLANGYEIVDMLGKEYDEGMKVTANFIEDEDLEAGKQIITGIVKPQINYKGIMIQSAQITVSQN